ncbi:MAG: MarR family transcriptional regulator [Lacrimispora sp.]
MDYSFESRDKECQLDSCLFFTTTKLARELGRMADEAFSKTGLSPSHTMVLYLINHRGGIQQKELGETLHLTPSTITRLLEKLERKELVSKTTKGKNAYLCTTQKGLSLQEEIITSWNRLRGGYNEILTEEETARFIEISSKLLKELDNNSGGCNL